VINLAIRYALLGLLSWHPFTGYELKKMISSSAIFYWSGSYNQIYNTLIHLLNEGFVTSEVQYGESSPTKKVYTITDAGLSNLKNWVLSGPEIPELRNTFLIQLAWADQLSGAELDALAGKYEEEISLALLMQQEKNRR
jgi:DNA-binding PadR family transcriptional regulator